MAILVAGLALGGVSFVECPKCDKRIRISEDGTTAFVNTSRIEPDRRDELAARAEGLLTQGSRVPVGGRPMPLMGWSSWNTFAVDISEEIIVGVAQAMATNGLRDAGYRYVNIDDGFFNGHGADGNLRFHPKRFPNGMKGTVDRIHALGMKAGIYSDAGSNTCGSSWNNDVSGIGAGLYRHDLSDCRLYFGEIGFDFFKVDYCGGQELKLDERTRYTEIAEAIRATGRTDVRLNICRWAFPGTWAADVAGSWRTTKDIRASWASVRDIIAENLYLSAYASPGHFNDLDMLEVGQRKGAVASAFGGEGDVGFTVDEEVTHFGMWCMLSSPLVLGCDVRNMRPESLRLVTNPYLLAMSQNDLGLQGYVVAREGEAYVLAKDADRRFGTSRYVALYNAKDSEHVFQVKASDLDLGGRIAAFDLVAKADIGEFADVVTVKVQPHASRFFRFDAEQRRERSVYEAETAFLTDYSELDGTPYGSEVSCRAQGRAFPTQVAAASGGVAVVNLGGRATNDLVWKEVRIDRSGTRTLRFRCASSGARTFFIQVDGDEPVELKSADTKGDFADVALDVAFSAGTHAVRLFNPSAPMPDVDVMKVEGVSE